MKKKKYRKLKGGIRMMNSQRSDAEKVSLIGEGKKKKKKKKLGINEVIKRNEIINHSLK